jgi:hypothetical protein
MQFYYLNSPAVGHNGFLNYGFHIAPASFEEILVNDNQNLPVFDRN